MVRYTLKQKWFVIQTYQQIEERVITHKERIRIIQERYHRKFGDPVPSQPQIYYLVKKADKYGSVENRMNKTGRKRSVRTAETIANVEALVIADQAAPVGNIVNTSHSNELGLKHSTWCRILKEDLKLRCYRFVISLYNNKSGV